MFDCRINKSARAADGGAQAGDGVFDGCPFRDLQPEIAGHGIDHGASASPGLQAGEKRARRDFGAAAPQTRGEEAPGFRAVSV